MTDSKNKKTKQKKRWICVKRVPVPVRLWDIPTSLDDKSAVNNGPIWVFPQILCHHLLCVIKTRGRMKANSGDKSPPEFLRSQARLRVVTGKASCSAVQRSFWSRAVRGKELCCNKRRGSDCLPLRLPLADQSHCVWHDIHCWRVGDEARGDTFRRYWVEGFLSKVLSYMRAVAGVTANRQCKNVKAKINLRKFVYEMMDSRTIIKGFTTFEGQVLVTTTL